jgi:hypothetical protein
MRIMSHEGRPAMLTAKADRLGRHSRLATAAALATMALALTGCPVPKVDSYALTSGAVTVTNSGGAVPVIVIAPGAGFTATVEVGNGGDEAVSATGSHSIFTSSGTVVQPTTVFGGPTTLPPYTANFATWNFGYTFGAGLPHDVYIVRVCAVGGSTSSCSEIQVNLTATPGFVDAETLNFEYVRDCVLYGKLGSIEELLPFLPSGYRAEYTLMHGTLSRQAANFTQPRVIMTGPTAHLTIAFNAGDPTTPWGFGTKSPAADPAAAKELEMIQFRDDTDSFEFRTLDFAQGKRVKISEPNPTLCQSCHGGIAPGTTPRPNWEPYPYWPGAFGSADDLGLSIAEFIGSPPVAQDPSVYCYPPTPPSDPVCQGLGERIAAEFADLPAFHASAGTHPRYQHLVDLDWMFPESGGSATNNTLTTARFTRLNFRRVANQLYRSVDPGQDPRTFQHAKFLIALLLSDCLETTTIPKSAYLPPQFLNVVPDGYHLGMVCDPSQIFPPCDYDVAFENLYYVTDNWTLSRFTSNPNLAVQPFLVEPKSLLLYALIKEAEEQGDGSLTPYFNLSPSCRAGIYDHGGNGVGHCKAWVKPSGCEPTCQQLAAASYQALQQWTSRRPSDGPVARLIRSNSGARRYSSGG